ncbi:universal stress protein [Streptomyces flavofungini]|uniref:Universal stress protein n=1 Tax=Streptomyces flavofungini TaxID=68200 RepID=A0ABS0XFC3_9ACTN|nr:universal stress protein [Streptomyces flavofungini]MBJ3811895.1 universal stress protein [Streptomyces flavofungini]GHC52636.1 stress-inducible protein [Streptomyces flavofungini]
MLRPIVAGLDGSRESAAAADWAAREALRRGLPLRLVHAWEALPDDGVPATLPELQVPQYWARRVLRNGLARLTEQYPHLVITGEQIKRPPIPALVSEADTAELLVLGNQGFGGPGRYLAGSIAMAAVPQVRQPVVLVRSNWSAADDHLPDADDCAVKGTACRDVVLGLDLRHAREDLLEFAFQAARFRGAALRIVHAWGPPRGSAGAGRGVGELERQAGAVGWELDALLDPWREKFPTVNARGVAVNGQPGQVLLRAAHGAGLLVVGRQPRLWAVGARIGRIGHLTIRRANCPVAVVAHD